MEQEQAPSSMTRRARVKKIVNQIQDLRTIGGDTDRTNLSKAAKQLNEVIDIDVEFQNVLNWSKDEARKFVAEWTKLKTHKVEAPNLKTFLNNDVMTKHVTHDSKRLKQEMEEQERHMRYATSVHEQMKEKDQETLAKYLCALENKIGHMMERKHGLNVQVQHLCLESNEMRFDQEDNKEEQKSGPSASPIPQPGAAGDQLPAIDDGHSEALNDAKILAVVDAPTEAKDDAKDDNFAGTAGGGQATLDNADPDAPVEQIMDKFIICRKCGPGAQLSIITDKGGLKAKCSQCNTVVEGTDQDKDAVDKAKANKDLVKALGLKK